MATSNSNSFLLEHRRQIIVKTNGGSTEMKALVINELQIRVLKVQRS